MSREELLEVARLVDGLGIADYWMVSGSNPETLKYEAMVTPSLYHPKGLFNDLAALTRSVVKVPVIVAGRVMTVEQAEAALAAGVCDMVGMTRALIADPELPRKTMRGAGRRHPGLRRGQRGLHRPAPPGQGDRLRPEPDDRPRGRARA